MGVRRLQKGRFKLHRFNSVADRQARAVVLQIFFRQPAPGRGRPSAAPGIGGPREARTPRFRLYNRSRARPAPHRSFLFLPAPSRPHLVTVRTRVMALVCVTAEELPTKQPIPSPATRRTTKIATCVPVMALAVPDAATQPSLAAIWRSWHVSFHKRSDKGPSTGRRGPAREIARDKSRRGAGGHQEQGQGRGRARDSLPQGRIAFQTDRARGLMNNNVSVLNDV